MEQTGRICIVNRPGIPVLSLPHVRWHVTLQSCECDIQNSYTVPKKCAIWIRLSVIHFQVGSLVFSTMKYFHKPNTQISDHKMCLNKLCSCFTLQPLSKTLLSLYIFSELCSSCTWKNMQVFMYTYCNQIWVKNCVDKAERELLIKFQEDLFSSVLPVDRQAWQS
jgi:hypothetical protein